MGRILKRMVAVAAFALATCLFVLPAHADDNIASGTWGTCPWEISSDGVLTIHPGIGADIESYYSMPWHEHKLNIERMVFAEEGGKKVVAPSVSRYLCATTTSMGVTSVDFSGIDTSQVTDMSYMFLNCWGLKKLDLTAFDTSSVTNMSCMFCGCAWLESVDVSSFDTSKVTDMSRMFAELGGTGGKFNSLDLSSFDTSSVENMSSMFFRCIHLKTITVGDSWSKAGVSNSEQMFGESGSLVGGNGTRYDAGHVDAEYARVDAPGSPGYLTALVQQPAKTDISGATVTVSPSSYTYDGSAKKPAVKVTLDSAILPASAYDVAYSDNVEAGTATVTVTGRDGYAGTAKATFSIIAANPEPTPEPEKQAMHRLYNPNSGEHFYTSDDAERDGLVELGWSSEGDGWTAPETSNTPVYRMYNPNAGEHHYCIDPDEKDGLVSAGWSYEGIGWYSDDNRTVPLYRDYNPNQFANNHNYTTDASEHEWLLSLGWRDEGYAWYGM